MAFDGLQSVLLKMRLHTTPSNKITFHLYVHKRIACTAVRVYHFNKKTG